MEKRAMLFVLSVAGGMFLHGGATAQVVLTGTRYTQNFDSIGDGLPAGWSVWDDATASSLGTAMVFETNTTSWADSAGEFRNCASITNNAGVLATNAASSTQHNFTNRVMAVRQGSSFGDPGAGFAFQVADTLGFSNLQFSVDFMMLDEESRETAWIVDYGFGTAPSMFMTLGTYTNSSPLGTVVRPTYVLGADANDQSDVVTIRVAALDGSTASGSRDTFGLDNFQLSFEGTATASAELGFDPVGDALVLSWSDPAFGLQSARAPSGTFTNITGASSPYTNTMDGDQMFFRLMK